MDTETIEKFVNAGNTQDQLTGVGMAVLALLQEQKKTNELLARFLELEEAQDGREHLAEMTRLYTPAK